MFATKIILFFYLNFVILQGIPQPEPPYEDFILQYEYYAMNNVEIFNIPTHIKGELNEKYMLKNLNTVGHWIPHKTR